MRSLWKLIDKIPGQKIISTHSGDLLSEVPPESIVRMHRPTGTLKAARLADVNFEPGDARKFYFHIRRVRGELLFARCWILGEGATEATLIPEAARILGHDLEQCGVRFVTYQTEGTLEPCLQVANCLGIHWIVVSDNDEQGAKDHKIVRKYLQQRTEQEVLFVMPEKDIEQHLCVNGFVDLYSDLLTEQPLKKVTVQPQESTYPIQVAQALPRYLKTHAAQQVVAGMRDDNRPVPQLFQNVINAAIKLTQTP